MLIADLLEPVTVNDVCARLVDQAAGSSLAPRPKAAAEGPLEDWRPPAPGLSCQICGRPAEYISHVAGCAEKQFVHCGECMGPVADPPPVPS